MLSDQNNVTLATTGALLSAALAGACAGFLPHNFHPARLFMGDSGSMLIGLVLAASALTPDGAVPGRCRPRRADSLLLTVLPVLLPISILMVPMRRPGARRRTTDAGGPLAVAVRTSSTCTTGCWRSATPSAAPC